MMRRNQLFLLSVCLGILLVYNRTSGQAQTPAGLTMVVSNPSCAQVRGLSGICAINVNSVTVSSTDPNFLGLQIDVNGKTRAFMSTFFESSVYLFNRMLGNGLQVNCGVPNASGLPTYGYQYQVGFSAIFTTGSGIPPVTDTAVVTCPYFESLTYMPIVKR